MNFINYSLTQVRTFQSKTNHIKKQKKLGGNEL